MHFPELQCLYFDSKFVPEGPIINNKSALIQEMAWRLLGAKPLPETNVTKMTSLSHNEFNSWPSNH